MGDSDKLVRFRHEFLYPVGDKTTYLLEKLLNRHPAAEFAMPFSLPRRLSTNKNAKSKGAMIAKNTYL